MSFKNWDLADILIDSASISDILIDSAVVQVPFISPGVDAPSEKSCIVFHPC